MDTSSIGVQTISTTTGTAAQNPNPAPNLANDNDHGDSGASTKRVTASPALGTGMVVDKTV
jgi:hypothetical protein